MSKRRKYDDFEKTMDGKALINPNTVEPFKYDDEFNEMFFKGYRKDKLGNIIRPQFTKLKYENSSNYEESNQIRKNMQKELENLEMFPINEEIWKIIDKFENYEVSTFGNIRQTKTGMMMKQHLDKNYFRIQLSKDGKVYMFRTHRLVCQAFRKNPNPVNKIYVDHIEKEKGKPVNNHINNLRWVSTKENCINRLKKDKKNKTLVKEEKDDEWKQIKDTKCFISRTGKCKNSFGKLHFGSFLGDYFKFSGKYVHVLVATYFPEYVPNDDPQNKIIVNHEDGNKKNNHYSNLKWVTSKENSQHAHDNGLINSKKKVFQYDKNLNFIYEFDSVSQASIATKVSQSNISQAARKITKKAGGFIWCYEKLNL